MDKSIPLCACGCGLIANRCNNPDGTFRRWSKYAHGHAKRDQKDIYTIPTDISALGYAAALIDGEGCIQVYLRYRNEVQKSVLSVNIGMSSPKCVTWMHKTFGGRLYQFKQNFGKKRPRMVWQIAASNVRPFLVAILPYLKEKDEQARIAILFADTFQSSGTRLSQEVKDKRDLYSRQLKALKQSNLLSISEAIQ